VTEGDLASERGLFSDQLELFFCETEMKVLPDEGRVGIVEGLGDERAGEDLICVQVKSYPVQNFWEL
jgi:hypothetical protein